MTPIRRSREIVVLILVSVAMLITGIVMGMEMAAWPEPSSSPVPPIAGYLRSVVAAVIVWLIGGHALWRPDKRLLALSFSVMLLADFFLVLVDLPIPGIALFFIVHGLLIARHARGLKASLAASAHRTRTLLWLSVAALIAYGVTAAILAVFWKLLANSGYLAVDAAYLAVLGTSLWMAFGTLTRPVWPPLNTWFIVLGLSFFFVCDVVVGLTVALGESPIGQTLSITVGVFYTPALLMLGLSGYCWGERGVEYCKRHASL